MCYDENDFRISVAQLYPVGTQEGKESLFTSQSPTEEVPGEPFKEHFGLSEKL